MERNKKPQLLILLFALLHLSTVKMDECLSLPDNDLSCYTDYNRIITCVWNSTYVSEQTEAECMIDAKKNTKWIGKYAHRTCKLEPIDISKPALKKCDMDLNKCDAFQSFETWTIELKCKSMNQSLKMDFKPFCNIKMNPSGIPHINFTTVSWSTKDDRRSSLKFFRSHLQWKQQDHSWSDPSVREKIKECTSSCETELDPDYFILGETYEARTRKKATIGKSTWSEWSPITTWVSTIGKTKPPTETAGGVLGMIIAGTVSVTLFVAVILIKHNKTTWVYIVAKIKGPPLPNPASSFLKDGNFQSGVSLYFTDKKCHSFMNQVEIMPVELTSHVDAVTPKLDAALLEKIRHESGSGSSNSSFTNPSYSHLCPAAPISSLTAGNLQPCASDTPYGPVGIQCKSENEEQNKEEERRKEIEILELLSKGVESSGTVQVISDYEKVEKVQIERMRLQSLDSGVCSAEEVSEESLEPDSINVNDSYDKEPEDKENEEEEDQMVKAKNFHALFGGTGGIFGKGSIQICSDYERVQKLQDESPELPSVDSGVGSGAEEQVSQEESPDDVDKSTESTRFLFPSPSCPSPSSLPSSLPQKFLWPGLSPVVLPLPAHFLGRTGLMSTSRSVEPSSDGYMPVQREQS
ncbi:hypothetical protein EXN66_Car003657 [Channa argus]|uniref:Interleukin-2 receptor subunit beta N-terminal domain-containing protein n=1 Tax=Channa argus TaxID=215402 RepID=A0A6G1PCK4_CHAAH|nr:hypothetical protein EXN66_Car003657 [Channa argus]